MTSSFWFQRHLTLLVRLWTLCFYIGKHANYVTRVPNEDSELNRKGKITCTWAWGWCLSFIFAAQFRKLVQSLWSVLLVFSLVFPVSKQKRIMAVPTPCPAPPRGDLWAQWSDDPGLSVCRVCPDHLLGCLLSPPLRGAEWEQDSVWGLPRLKWLSVRNWASCPSVSIGACVHAQVWSAFFRS